MQNAAWRRFEPGRPAAPSVVRPWEQRVADQLASLDEQQVKDERDSVEDEFHLHPAPEPHEFEKYWAKERRYEAARLLPGAVFTHLAWDYMWDGQGPVASAIARARGSTIVDLCARWYAAIDLVVGERPAALDAYMGDATARLERASKRVAAAHLEETRANTALDRARQGLSRLRRRRIGALEAAVGDAQAQSRLAEDELADARARVEAIKQRSGDISMWDRQHSSLLADGAAARLELTSREVQAELTGVSWGELVAEEFERLDEWAAVRDTPGSTRVAAALELENGSAPEATAAIQTRAVTARHRAILEQRLAAITSTVERLERQLNATAETALDAFLGYRAHGLDDMAARARALVDSAAAAAAMPDPLAADTLSKPAAGELLGVAATDPADAHVRALAERVASGGHAVGALRYTSGRQIAADAIGLFLECQDNPRWEGDETAARAAALTEVFEGIQATTELAEVDLAAGLLPPLGHAEGVQPDSPPAVGQGRSVLLDGPTGSEQELF